ncbi:MAG: stage II sporulation protein R [Ruminococcus flavefaciens]|nr:stage II sporulation protein R [Ruminococcus flavefaciens]MCM1230552.1 stage II sporulation protein R [Ruminococcus flavefaciens]
MKKSVIFGIGLIMSILITNSVAVIRDGRRLDGLRESVLRLHILAESDSEYDQNLKLKVRDAILESSILAGADSLESAEQTAQNNLDKIVETAENVLRENGCNLPVSAEIADVEFDERVYGDITMPAGKYRALRVEIGSAQGKNWWCVMYPPLCIPAVCDVEEDKSAEELFSDSELDIMYHPKKYEVRFAVWDKIKEIMGK